MAKRNNSVRKTKAGPTLRERAASLKASASRVIRGKPTVAADPTFAAIAETQRLADARKTVASLPQPPGSIDPLPEQVEACKAFFAHVDNVLLKTVPTTATGCAALARYAGDFLKAEGFVLDEQGFEHVRILDLIARSPLR